MSILTSEAVSETFDAVYDEKEAAGLVEPLLPKELLPAAPGGMPYYVVIDS